MNQDSNNNNPNLMDTDLFKFLDKFKFRIVGVLAFVLVCYASFYKVDASEQAVVLRFGKFHATTGPGLHFKLPFIDSVERVPVKKAFEEVFGLTTFTDSSDAAEKVETPEQISLMMTNDPSIMEVIWTVQYRITDPKDYLFNVKDVTNTIRDVSETAMRLYIGDNKFEKILDNRDQLTLEEDVHKFMQQILDSDSPDSYDTGITITQVKITSAKYPNEVAPAFDEVFKAQKDKDIAIKNAKAIEYQKVKKAEGDVAIYNSLLEAYIKYPDITAAKMKLDAQKQIFGKVKDKTVIDSELESLQHLNIGKKP